MPKHADLTISLVFYLFLIGCHQGLARNNQQERSKTVWAESTICFTQEKPISIQGRVTNSKGDPIAYVNIGLLSSATGTVSNKHGAFELTVPASHRSDTLMLSAIGYHSRKIMVNKAKSQTQFPLKAKVYQSERVTIKANKAEYKTEKLGDWKPILGYSYACFSSAGCKMVKRLAMPKDSAYLEKIRVWIRTNKDTTARARAWVHEVDNGKPGQPIVKESVVKKVPKGKNWLVFKVGAQNISVKDDFFVGIEFLGKGNPKIDGPYVGARLSNKPGESWQVYLPHGSWQQFENDYVMQAIIRYQP